MTRLCESWQTKKLIDWFLKYGDFGDKFGIGLGGDVMAY
jgi:hypothetical protein